MLQSSNVLPEFDTCGQPAWAARLLELWRRRILLAPRLRSSCYIAAPP